MDFNLYFLSRNAFREIGYKPEEESFASTDFDEILYIDHQNEKKSFWKKLKQPITSLSQNTLFHL
jgi:hypothetical protein